MARLPSMPGGAAPRILSLTRGISLVVADVPADTYRAGAIEARLSDLDWVARAGAAHHAVADALQLTHTVVPFRLFTLFSSERRALAALRRSARRIDAALDRVKGRAEWVLRIGKPSPGGRTSRKAAGNRTAQPRAASGAPSARRALGTPSGTAFLRAKATERQAAADSAARIVADTAAVFDSLAHLADASTRRPLEPATGLLLDAAFLVPARQSAAFKRALTRGAQGLLGEGCRVSLTGPWPPYSFVALDTRPRRG